MADFKGKFLPAPVRRAGKSTMAKGMRVMSVIMKIVDTCPHAIGEGAKGTIETTLPDVYATLTVLVCRLMLLNGTTAREYVPSIYTGKSPEWAAEHARALADEVSGTKLAAFRTTFETIERQMLMESDMDENGPVFTTNKGIVQDIPDALLEPEVDSTKALHDYCSW